MLTHERLPVVGVGATDIHSSAPAQPSLTAGPYDALMRVGERLQQLAGPQRAREVLAGQLAFERLEWLGDSVLDVLAARAVSLSAPVDASAGAIHPPHSDLVSDRVMSRAALRFDLPQVSPALRPGRFDDPDPFHRLGDSVEAWIGGAWLSGGWAAATEASRLVPLLAYSEVLLVEPAPCPTLPLNPVPAELRAWLHVQGWTPHDASWIDVVGSPVPFRRRLVAAGAACLEQAAGAWLFAQHPQYDEGRLSRERDKVTSPERLTALAQAMPAPAGFQANDRLLLAVLGAALLDAGAVVGSELAARLLKL